MPIAVLVLSIVLAGHARAAEAPASVAAPLPPATNEHAPGAVAPRLPVHLMSPMVAEIFAALDEQRDKIARLRVELTLERDGARAFQLQRALSAAKQETEVRLLRIQASHARREGRLEVAGNLEAAIAAMTVPPASREPMARPAPSRDGDR
jgi:hypothetical protein